MEKEVKFEQAGETKNCFKFLEIDEETGKQLDPRDGIIGMLYVKKRAFDQGGAAISPSQLTVRVSW